MAVEFVDDCAALEDGESGFDLEKVAFHDHILEVHLIQNLDEFAPERIRVDPVKPHSDHGEVVRLDELPRAVSRFVDSPEISNGVGGLLASGVHCWSIVSRMQIGCFAYPVFNKGHIIMESSVV